MPADDLLDPDGLLEPMTKTREAQAQVRAQAQLSEAAKAERDALLVAAVETMRQAR